MAWHAKETKIRPNLIGGSAYYLHLIEKANRLTDTCSSLHLRDLTLVSRIVTMNNLATLFMFSALGFENVYLDGATICGLCLDLTRSPGFEVPISSAKSLQNLAGSRMSVS